MFRGRDPEEKIPAGIVGCNQGRAYSSDHVSGYSAHPAAGRTFDVSPHHERLPSGNGVKFAVETVTPADKEDSQKPVLSSSELRRNRKAEAKAFYQSDENRGFGYMCTDFTPMRIEAESPVPAGLVYTGSDAFLHTCLTAFARHLPLALAPDHIWALLTYGFAKHVDNHAEELRKHFVQHEGKKRLEVSVDHFTMSGGVEDAGTPAALWERDVFPDFSRQIREHIGAPIHDMVAGSFSTTDNTSKAVSEIVLMSAMKNYFSYGMTTCCGIPEITLRGSKEDWVALRARAEALGSVMLPEFAEGWLSCLLPVLDEFVASYDGEVNHGFWQSMVKLRHTGGGSGSYSFISGWIQILYPYMASGRSSVMGMRPWSEMYFSGPEVSEFPSVSSSAPVDWEYYGSTHDLHFHAGFSGMVQDPATGEVSPVLGWHVTHDPPQDKAARLTQVEKELNDLSAGHAGEKEEGAWYHRVCVLRKEAEQLKIVLELIEQQRDIKALHEQQYSRELSLEQRKAISGEKTELEKELHEKIRRLESA